MIVNSAAIYFSDLETCLFLSELIGTQGLLNVSCFFFPTPFFINRFITFKLQKQKAYKDIFVVEITAENKYI